LGLSVPDLRAEGEKLRWASVGGPSQRFSQLAELQALDLPPTNAEIAELLRAKRAKAPMFCSAPSAGPREARFSGKLRRVI